MKSVSLHELELEFMGGVEQSFAVSLVEPNAAGKVIPIGLDSGVIVSTSRTTRSPCGAGGLTPSSVLLAENQIAAAADYQPQRPA